MFHVVTGGSGSGKSEYAEGLIVEWGKQYPDAGRYYIATMMPYGEETKRKIARHQRMRAGKGFQTIECYVKLADAADEIIDRENASGYGPGKPLVLLECMSNMVANELYADGGAREKAADMIMEGIRRLEQQCECLAVVTNEVFSESTEDSEEMKEYKRVLGEVNRRMAKMAEEVTEVVYGIPVEVKR